MKPFNRRLILALTVVFLSGAVAGALVHRYYFLQTVNARPDRPRSPKEYREAYLSEMKSRLKLDDTQMDKLGHILTDTEKRFRELRERTKPEMKAIHDAQTEQVNAILTAQQQSEYALLRKEREERRKKFDKR